MTNIKEMTPAELVLGLFKDIGNAAKYRREIEKRIKKSFYEVSLEDMEAFLDINLELSSVTQVTPHQELISIFHENGEFRPLPREDFSKVGAWRIAEAILNTGWEGCYTRTQGPYDSLMTLQRVRDKKLVIEDDFDSHAHANLFRVVVGEFNKWASRKYSKGQDRNV